MNSGKWIFCTVLFLTMSMGMSYGQMAAGSNRPASVPSDYVITPFGYFHPSCVREIKEGETVLADGRIRFENGTEEANIPFCNFPRYTSRGEPVVKGSADPGPLYISWDWIEAGQVSTSSSSYGKITATWTVPMTPATNDGQTLFFFPGFMDINDVELIIQPVLGWNDGQSGVGPWNIASWNCCPSGTANYSTPVTVNTGDVIQGIIKGTCKAGTQSCSTWNITTKDETTGKRRTDVQLGAIRRAGGLQHFAVQRLSAGWLHKIQQGRFIRLQLQNNQESGLDSHVLGSAGRHRSMVQLWGNNNGQERDAYVLATQQNSDDGPPPPPRVRTGGAVGD